MRQKDTLHGINEDTYDSGRAYFYINGLDEDNTKLGNSVDYLASGYAVSKKHIEDYFSGEEKTKLLGDLETKFNAAVEQAAAKSAEQVGGFFEENGVSGETQKIHDSIVKAYQNSVDQYSSYIKDNKNYANLDKIENEWLKKDDSYMACQLRKAVKSDKTAAIKAGETEYYSMEEIDKTKEMISEIKSYEPGSNADSLIGVNCSEEEIGFKLAELGLKGEIFNKFSGVSSSLKNAISKSIKRFTDMLADKLNKELNKERKAVAEPGRLEDFDQKKIFAVYNHIMNT